MSPVLERAYAAPVFFIIAKTVKFLLVSFHLMPKEPMTAPSAILSGLINE
jgi:hypothetical protein